MAITGDLHAFQCGVLGDGSDPSRGMPVIVIVDFVCAGISSTSLYSYVEAAWRNTSLAPLVASPAAFDAFLPSNNPGLRYVDHDAQGYASATVTSARFVVVFNKVGRMRGDRLAQPDTGSAARPNDCMPRCDRCHCRAFGSDRLTSKKVDMPSSAAGTMEKDRVVSMRRSLLGLRAVIAGSIARIHRENQINSGVLPLQLCDEADTARRGSGARLTITGIGEGLKPKEGTCELKTTISDEDVPPARRIAAAARNSRGRLHDRVDGCETCRAFRHARTPHDKALRSWGGSKLGPLWSGGRRLMFRSLQGLESEAAPSAYADALRLSRRFTKNGAHMSYSIFATDPQTVIPDAGRGIHILASRTTSSWLLAQSRQFGRR